MPLKKILMFSSCVLATASLAACSHGPTPAEAKKLTIEPPTQAQIWANELAKQDVLLIKQGWRLIIVIPADRLFEDGSADLRPSAQPLLRRVAEIVRNYARQSERPYPIRVWGFADNVFNRSFQKSMAADYAQTVGSYLWNQGFSHQELSIVSKGIQDPIAPQNTTLGRAFNRRVVIQVH